VFSVAGILTSHTFRVLNACIKEHSEWETSGPGKTQKSNTSLISLNSSGFHEGNLIFINRSLTDE